MRRDMRLFLVAMTSFHCADSKTIGNHNTLRGLCNVFASGSGFVRDFVLEKVAPRFRSVSFFVVSFYGVSVLTRFFGSLMTFDK